MIILDKGPGDSRSSKGLKAQVPLHLTAGCWPFWWMDRIRPGHRGGLALLIPVGDGDQLRAVVGAEAPGLAIGHRVLSQPVAGGAVPRPTLAQESGQKRGCLEEGCFSLTPKSRGGDANRGTAELSSGLGTGPRGLVWHQSQLFLCCVCTVPRHTALPTITHSCQVQGGCVAQGRQPVTRPGARPRKRSGPLDSPLGYLNQETYWENCQLAGK